MNAHYVLPVIEQPSEGGVRRGGARRITHQCAARSPLASNKQVIIRVASDPNPNHVAVQFRGDRTVVEAYSGRPQFSYPFELQGWVSRILQQQLMATIG